MMQSRENDQKPQFGHFFDDLEVKYLQIANFFELRTRLIKVSDFELIWRPFGEYLQINNFFQKSGSVTFQPLQSPNFMQKIRKILRAISEKTALPTNQPTNQLLPKTPILQDLADAGPKKENINIRMYLINIREYQTRIFRKNKPAEHSKRLLPLSTK